MNRMGRRLAAVLCGISVVLLCATPASADPAENCDAGGLGSKATVTAGLRVEVKDLDLPKATSTVTVRVPQSWSLSIGLRADPWSESYANAMRCLLNYEADEVRYSETRDQSPEVVVGDGFVLVTDVTYGDLDYSRNPILVGLWTITTNDDRWRVELRNSAALAGAKLDEIRVEAPRAWTVGVFPWPPTQADTRRAVWREPPAGGEAPGVVLEPDSRTLSTHLTRHDGWRWVTDPLLWIFDAILLALLLVALIRLRQPAETRWARRVLVLGLFLPVLSVAAMMLANQVEEMSFPLSWPAHDYVTNAAWIVLALVAGWLVRLPALVMALFTLSLTTLWIIVPPLLPGGVDGASEADHRWLLRLVGAVLVTLMTSMTIACLARVALRAEEPVRVSLRTFLCTRSGAWCLGLSLLVTVGILLQRWTDTYADWVRTRWVQFPKDPLLRVFGDELRSYVATLGGFYELVYLALAVSLIPLLRRLLEDDRLDLPEDVRPVVCFAAALVVLPAGERWAGWWFPAGAVVGLVLLFLITGPLGRRNDKLWARLRNVQ